MIALWHFIQGLSAYTYKKSTSAEHTTVPQTRVNAICCRLSTARPHDRIIGSSPAQFVLLISHFYYEM